MYKPQKSFIVLVFINPNWRLKHVKGKNEQCLRKDSRNCIKQTACSGLCLGRGGIRQ